MLKILICVLAIFALVSIAYSAPIEITIEYGNETCTENWNCTAWFECIEGMQIRTCIDLNNCNTTYIKPVEIQNCADNCTESWTCTEWSGCVDSQQARVCTDANNCGTIIEKPAESRSCTVTPPGGTSGPSAPSGPTITSGIKSGNKTTSPEPEREIPPEPELKKSSYVQLELTTIDEIEAGEPFIVNVVIKSMTPIDTTVELLNKRQNVSLKENEMKTLTFEVNAPETEGYYNLVATTPNATGNKTVFLIFKPLFLYVTHLENQSYEIRLKNFDNASTTEIQIVKDRIQTVYLDSIYGKTDYNVVLTFSKPGEYLVKAKTISGLITLDEDMRALKIEGEAAVNYGLLILIIALIVILMGSILIFKELKR